MKAQEKVQQLAGLIAKRQKNVIETETGFEEIKEGKTGQIRSTKSALAMELFGEWPLSDDLVPVWNAIIHPKFKIDTGEKKKRARKGE
ncbi:MAG: hypothetical protein KAK04_18795 [Cyclobacteriaceae bacterium]|nr:hypothetical protein [Cyclobacteriaceae bacterium]